MNRVKGLTTTSIVLPLLVALAAPGSAFAQEQSRWMQVGLRTAYIHAGSGSFQQSEVFIVHSMRTTIDLGDDWVGRARWEMSAGRLEHEGIDAVVFAAGPTMEFRKGDEPWFIHIGSRPTLISSDDFNQRQFGGPFQFTSHGGVGWGTNRFEIRYHIQHMSNAGIYKDNDGLNLHAVSLSWEF